MFWCPAPSGVEISYPTSKDMGHPGFDNFTTKFCTESLFLPKKFLISDFTTFRYSKMGSLFRFYVFSPITCSSQLNRPMFFIYGERMELTVA